MKKMMLKGLSDFLKVTELVKRSFIAGIRNSKPAALSNARGLN